MQKRTINKAKKNGVGIYQTTTQRADGTFDCIELSPLGWWQDGECPDEFFVSYAILADGSFKFDGAIYGEDYPDTIANEQAFRDLLPEFARVIR
ncbi:MAG: hypothetical protein WDZ51_03850 [Pirellulaceae bacterium]